MHTGPFRPAFLPLYTPVLPMKAQQPHQDAQVDHRDPKGHPQKCRGYGDAPGDLQEWGEHADNRAGDHRGAGAAASAIAIT